jgi:transposase
MARKRYNDEFKVAAAKLVREQGYTVTKAAQGLGVDPGSIRAWVRKYAPAPMTPTTEADASTEGLRRENLRLREENRRLLMEREILKKATAFFAREQP